MAAMQPILALASLLAALSAAGAALAQPSLFLEELTSSEVRAAIKAGKTTLLLPIGGTEQNGDHIALGKHNVRARLLAGAIAARLDNALVAPVVSYVPEGSIDPPTGHMRQPGTITIPEDAFEKTLESAARSLITHGFTTIVLLGDHGGYRRSLEKVASRLNRGGKRPAVLVPPEYYREMEHAGVDDTALTLAIDPRLVRDPRGASVERGRAARDDIVERTARAVAKALAR
jgi:creatinine amidohydrolase/Fe(II)-dependent formamide hydrolase-like protein